MKSRRLRVLWMTSDPLPEVAQALGTPNIATMGGWLPALSQAIAQTQQITLGITSRIVGGKSTSFTLNGVEQFIVAVPRMVRSGLLRPNAVMLRRYQEIVNQFSPDVIHIHGTEWYGGLVTKDDCIGCPVIISLQGLIDYHIRHLTGHLGFFEILESRSAKEWLMFNGLWEKSGFWKKRAIVEREIVSGHRLFIGRTLWDRAHLRRLNPEASYFHCHEMVRDIFFKREWNVTAANRHTIFAPSAAGPLKGFHVLVKAVAILRREFPDVRVRVPLARFASPHGIRGLYARMRRDGYDNYLARLIDRLGVGEHITALGRLSGEEMADEMQRAHAFALNSFVENSPNTMAEALTVGTPCVVSLVGGIPSLIHDGANAMGFPSGDEAVLAEQIRRVFTDDALATRMSRTAKETARSRHSLSSVSERMNEIYTAVSREADL